MGTAELGIEQLSDECALGLFIARTVQRSDDDRWTQESGEKISTGLTLFQLIGYTDSRGNVSASVELRFNVWFLNFSSHDKDIGGVLSDLII